MSNVFDIDEKLIANNPRLIEWMNLSEDISSWLPVNSISSNVIDYCCKVHLYEKKDEWDWMDKIDCYLGIPEYIEKEDDLSKVQYKIFPLSLVYHIAQLSSNNVQFSFRFEPEIENEVYILHFNYETFAEHLSSFEHGLENNLRYWVNKVTLKWKALIKKIKDKPYKYSELRMSIQLSYYYGEHKRNIKKSIIKTIIKEKFDYSIGLDYGLLEHLKRRDGPEEVKETFDYFDIPMLYDFEYFDGDDEKENTLNNFNNLFPTLLSFGAELVNYHFYIKRDFQDNPSNHIIERELDFLENIISNTKEKLLNKFGYIDLDE